MLITLDLSMTVAPATYGAAATPDAQRGPVTTRTVKVAASVLTRASTHNQFEVAAGEELAINLGSGTQTRLLWVESDRAVKVRTSAADGEQVDVEPLATGAPGILIKTGAITGLWVKNPGTEAAIISVLAAGLE